MKLSNKLAALAEWLENPENTILVASDQDSDTLASVAFALSGAADLIKGAAEDVAVNEPETTTPIFSPEKLDEMAAVAEAFDASGDELLMKQASILDEILLTIAVPQNAVLKAKSAADEKIDQIKKKYKTIKEELDEINKVSDTLDALKKSDVYKEYPGRQLHFPMSQRNCPDHAGVQMQRVGATGDGSIWQCALDHKIYNWENGFKLLDGSTVAGSSIDRQTKLQHQEFHAQFDTRQSRLGLE